MNNETKPNNGILSSSSIEVLVKRTVPVLHGREYMCEKFAIIVVLDRSLDSRSHGDGRTHSVFCMVCRRV